MTIGVVLMAYGSPSSLDDVAAYYTHIRRGRPPSPEQLQELIGRYEAIGGISPLVRRSEAQRDQLAEALDTNQGSGAYEVVLGYKHATPFIEDAVADLAGRHDDLEDVVGLVLAPHYSRASVGDYLRRLASAAAEHGVPMAGIERWHHLDPWLDFQAQAVRAALAAMPAATKVFFTAHSLPVAALAGDPYDDELRTSAMAIAERVGLERWSGSTIAWQSAGRTADPWQGPDIVEVIDDLADTGRAEGVIVCPQGFTADHLELLYDLDIVAREHAEKRGLAFTRTPTVNDDETVFKALAELIVATTPAAG